MQVLVSDTSVLVDLERGGLLQVVFRLSWEFAVPDILYERELKDYGGPGLVKLGLQVMELDEKRMAKAVEYRNAEKALSFPDAMARMSA